MSAFSHKRTLELIVFATTLFDQDSDEVSDKTAGYVMLRELAYSGRPAERSVSTMFVIFVVSL